MSILRKLAVVVIALACISGAYADPVTVDNETDFLAQVGDVTIEGFESFPTDSGCSTDGSPHPTTINTSLLSVSSAPQNGGTSFLCIGTTNATTGPRPTEGAYVLNAGSGTDDSWILSFSLAQPVLGVGFYLTDAAEQGDIFFSIGGESYLMAAAPVSTLNPIYFGFVSDEAFSSFDLVNTGQGDGWGIDQVMLALCASDSGCGSTSVPEPGTLALLGLGLVGMAARRRKRA